jgi:YihY family inner membrane protein
MPLKPWLALACPAIGDRSWLPKGMVDVVGAAALPCREAGRSVRFAARVKALLSFPLWTFSWRVLVNFRRNQGLLLAGAVAYYALLSIVPLFALLLVGLAHVFERDRLIAIATTNLEVLVPGYAEIISEQVAGFLDNREVIGLVGGGSLLFFSAMAFSVLESAMAAIFHHREAANTRHPLVSAVLPYCFVMALGFGLVLITLISGGLEAIGRGSVHLFGHDVSLARLSHTLLRLVSLAGEIAILTALYYMMPVGRMAWRRAVMGATAATLLWELVRRVLVYYFANLSMVNVLYGSLATAIVVLLTLEVGAIILLLGAQVIAELERGAVGKQPSPQQAAALAHQTMPPPNPKP